MTMCCNAPQLNWTSDPSGSGEFDMVCSVCGVQWKPANILIEQPQTPIESAMLFEPLDSFEPSVLNILTRIEAELNGSREEVYKAAWVKLTSTLPEKTSWGKNALKDLMQACLIDPSAS